MTHAAPRAFLALALAGALAACGESPQAPAATPAVEAPPAAAAPPAFAPYAIGDVKAAGNCSLDAIDGAAPQGASMVASRLALFGGWLADAQGAVPADALFVLRGTRSYAVPLVAGGERPDVAQALNSEGARLSGFNVTANLEGVDPGEYSLAIVHSGDSASCDLNASVVVTQG